MGHDAAYGMRNLSYGMLDSVISTTGVLAGLAYGGVDRWPILLTGILLVGVEATSMSFGAALSDEHFELTDTQQVSKERKWKSALVMLLAYALTGAALLVPYALSASPKHATTWTVCMAAAAMFGLVAWFQGAAKAAGSTVIGMTIIGLSTQAGKALNAQ